MVLRESPVLGVKLDWWKINKLLDLLNVSLVSNPNDNQYQHGIAWINVWFECNWLVLNTAREGASGIQIEYEQT